MFATDTKFLVMGAGKSGTASAAFLVRQGFEVALTDLQDIKIDKNLSIQEQKKIKIFPREYPNFSEFCPHIIILSPGISADNQYIISAKEKGIKIMGEIELAYIYSHTPLIAITGTNGKTTTTSLVGRIFMDAGFHTLLGGNIGITLIDKIEQFNEKDVVVAEISSFQLETIEKFRPFISAILNITPDHLDRHHNMSEYIAAKSNIFLNQKKEDFLVLNYDERLTAGLAKKANSKIIFFSLKTVLEEGVFVEGEKIFSTFNMKRTEICNVEDIFIKGRHNLENCLAATAIALAWGISPESIKKSLQEFMGVEHRLEFVSEKNGITFYNDSKGTNPEASIKAIEAFSEPIILLAGGRNKGSSFTLLSKVIKERVRKVFILGECKKEIEESLLELDFNSYELCETFEEAFQKAAQEAKKGETVLLSPACASWDMFNNYEERGRLFKELVHAYEYEKEQ